MEIPPIVYERLERIDRRIRVIGRIVILIETVGAGWLFYRVGIDALSLSEGYALILGAALGLAIGAISQREFDR